MADDTLSRFIMGKVRPQSPPEPASKPLPPELVVHHSLNGREAYEAFDNKIRAMNVEVRCHRSGISYSLPYAHLGGIIFNFRTGNQLMFTACGYAVTIKGRNLRDILLALNLHTCGFIQDFDPQMFVLPEPVDPKAAFVEMIIVEVLHGKGAQGE